MIGAFPYIQLVCNQYYGIATVTLKIEVDICDFLPDFIAMKSVRDSGTLPHVCVTQILLKPEQY